MTARRGVGFDLVAAIAAVLGRLTAAGIRAVADIRDINPPCVYVPPPTIAWGFGKAQLGWTVAAVVPATGRDVALKNLAPLITAAANALAASPVTGGRPIDLGGVDGGAPLPAYELTFATTELYTERTAP